MKLLTKPFTDIHGNTFPAAILVAYEINEAISANTNTNTTVVDGEVLYLKSPTTNSSYLSFRAWIYKDSAALASGLAPMIMRDSALNEYFSTVAPDPAILGGTELAEYCEQWIIDNIIK